MLSGTDDLAERRKRDAIQARLLVDCPAWPWFRGLMETARRRALAESVSGEGTDTQRLQHAAVAHFIDVILEVPEKRLAELARGQMPSAVDDLPRPARSSDAGTLVR